MPSPEPWPVLCFTSANIPVFFLCNYAWSRTLADWLYVPLPVTCSSAGSTWVTFLRRPVLVPETWPIGYMPHFRSLAPAQVQLGEHSLYVPFLFLFQFLFCSCIYAWSRALAGWLYAPLPFTTCSSSGSTWRGLYSCATSRSAGLELSKRVPEPFSLTCSEGVTYNLSQWTFIIR